MMILLKKLKAELILTLIYVASPQRHGLQTAHILQIEMKISALTVAVFFCGRIIFLLVPKQTYILIQKTRYSVFLRIFT